MIDFFQFIIEINHVNLYMLDLDDKKIGFKPFFRSVGYMFLSEKDNMFGHLNSLDIWVRWTFQICKRQGNTNYKTTSNIQVIFVLGDFDILLFKAVVSRSLLTLIMFNFNPYWNTFLFFLENPYEPFWKKKENVDFWTNLGLSSLIQANKVFPKKST